MGHRAVGRARVLVSLLPWGTAPLAGPVSWPASAARIEPVTICRPPSCVSTLSCDRALSSAPRLSWPLEAVRGRRRNGMKAAAIRSTPRTPVPTGPATRSRVIEVAFLFASATS
ncbi:MAG: hypothetical protein ABSF03_19155 [Streptosporangiaceae bacterium]